MLTTAHALLMDEPDADRIRKATELPSACCISLAWILQDRPIAVIN